MINISSHSSQSVLKLSLPLLQFKSLAFIRKKKYFRCIQIAKSKNRMLSICQFFRELQLIRSLQQISFSHPPVYHHYISGGSAGPREFVYVTFGEGVLKTFVHMKLLVQTSRVVLVETTAILLEKINHYTIIKV